jgi:SAM-dependent methyltransferase
MIVLWAFALLLFASFMLIVFRGAPYVPIKKHDLEKLFSMIPRDGAGCIVDLGSGDGRVLLEASRRGIPSVGYELNPFLVALSRFRARQSVGANVLLRDFWQTPLPDSTTVVFVFLATPYMAKLDRKLKREVARLGHDILLISYGVSMPFLDSDMSSGPFLGYSYKA